MKRRILLSTLPLALLVSMRAFSQSPGGVSSGLATWQKADDGVTTSDAAAKTSWKDNSPNGYNLTTKQRSYNTSPRFYASAASGKLVNFNPTLYFTTAGCIGNNNQLFASNSPYTFMSAAVDEQTSTGYHFILSSATVGYASFQLGKYCGASCNNTYNGWTLYHDALNYKVSDKANSYAPAGGSSGVWNGTTFSPNNGTQPQIVGVASGNSTTGTVTGKFLVDGFSNDYSATQTYRTQTFKTLQVGCNYTNAAQGWTGRIPEVIAWSRQLSPAELQRVSSYLAIKYGVTLGQGGSVAGLNKNTANYDYIASDGTTKMWNATTGTNFAYNITGIGKDNGSALDQRISKSQNSNIRGAVATIANGNALVTTNAAGTSIVTDKSFDVIGDNNVSGLTAYPNASGTGAGTLPSNVSKFYRLGKVWMAQETGTVGNVTIAIGKVIFSKASTPYIVTASDANFTTNVTYIAATWSNGSASATIDLPAGISYFTLAGYAPSPAGVANGLATWQRADDGFTNDDGTITSWADVSGNNYDLTSSQTGTFPTFNATAASGNLVNFNPSLSFNVNADIANTNPLMAYNSPYTFLSAAIDELAGTGYHFILSSTGSNTAYFELGKVNTNPTYNGWHMYLNAQRYVAGNATSFSPASGSNGVYNGSGFDANIGIQPQLVGIASPNTPSASLNANTTLSGTFTVDGFLNDFSTTHYFSNTLFQSLHIGSNYGTAVQGWKGRIPEVMAWSRQLSKPEIQKVNSYLAIKYGVTLGQGGSVAGLNKNTANYDYLASDGTTKMWDATAGSAFNANITGIGKDELGTLDQSVSMTQNSNVDGAVVTIANGNSIPELNADGLSISTDKSFEVFGDNDSSGVSETIPTASGTGSATQPTTVVNFRLNKVWMVQETGTVGTVTLSAASTGFSTAGAAYLVTASDAAMTSNVTFTKVTWSGKNAVVSIDLPAGTSYFTVAGFSPCPGGVSKGLTFWGAADLSGNAVGSAMTKWQDISPNGSKNDLTNIAGSGFTLQAGNAAHNFNPWTTGYSSTKYFYGNNTKSFSNYNTSLFQYSAITVFGAARPTSAAIGAITGVDNETNNGAEPMLGVNVASGVVYPWVYRASNAINSVASGASMQATLNKSSVFSYQLPYNGTNGATGSGSGNLTFGLDGSTTTTTVRAEGSTAGPYIHIGVDNWSANTGFPGDIQEVIWYKSAFTATEMAKVNAYLAIKYGTTLTSGTATDYLSPAGTVIWPGDATYQYNMAGIGREDLELLNQKQSNSVNANTNSQVVIGLTSVATTNELNTNVFTKDSTYLIWGDNNNTQTLTAAFTTFDYNGYSNNRRMNRIWKMQNKGKNAMTQSVKIQFPTASVGTTTLTGELTACAKYRLIVSTDPTFATGTTTYVLTTVGANYESLVKFPAGTTYFTYAKVNSDPTGVATLPTADATVPYNDPCLKAIGWKYYHYDSNKEQRAFAINWNGNTEPGGMNGVLTYEAGHYTNTSGAYMTTIMGRLMEILPAGGNFTVNGGVKVKIFFDSTELASSLVADYTSAKWFKYSGNSTATIAANDGTTINGAAFISPSSSGEEDGVDYVTFDGIRSFSTFGYASSNYIYALPIKQLSFNVVKGMDDNSAAITWTAKGEQNVDHYEIQRSGNGATFKVIGSGITANKVQGDITNKYSAYDPAILQGNNYYRLKVVDNNGSVSYSPVRVLSKNGTTNFSVQVVPNPVVNNSVLQITSNEDAAMKLVVMDVTGKVIIDEMITVSKGLSQRQLNTDGFAKGVYYVKVTGANANGTVKMLIIR